MKKWNYRPTLNITEGFFYFVRKKFLEQKKQKEIEEQKAAVKEEVQEIKNVNEEGLSAVIGCRKAAGLDAIELTDNIEVITICGMGGKLISDILEDGKDKLINKPNLILQPNVGESFVREKLQQLGYNIVAENIMEEDGHIYEVIVAKAGEMNLTEEEKVFGKYLLKEKSDLFIKKQKLELNKIKYILSQLQKAKEIQKDKVEELEKRYKEIQDIISV